MVLLSAKTVAMTWCERKCSSWIVLKPPEKTSRPNRLEHIILSAGKAPPERRTMAVNILLLFWKYLFEYELIDLLRAICRVISIEEYMLSRYGPITQTKAIW